MERRSGDGGVFVPQPGAAEGDQVGQLCRGLGDAEALGGPAEVQFIGDGDEVHNGVMLGRQP